MWHLVTSLEVLVQSISGVFTEPSFKTHCEVFVGWLMCIGRRTEFRVFETIEAGNPIDRNERHPFDRFSPTDEISQSGEVIRSIVIVPGHADSSFAGGHRLFRPFSCVWAVRSMLTTPTPAKNNGTGQYQADPN